MKKEWLIVLIGLLVLSCGPGKKKDNRESIQNTPKEITVTALTKNTFLEKVNNYEQNGKEWNFLGDKPAIIDFYASWCGPCKMIAPILEELSKEYQGKVDFYKVDTEKEPELAAAFNIRSIPAILFIPLKGTPQMNVGAMRKDEFKQMIDSMLLNKQSIK